MPICNWRYGARCYAMARIATAKAVADTYAIGLNSDLVVLPSDETWVTDLATTRTNFKNRFLGIADQVKAANVARIPGNSEDNKIRTTLTGVYDIPITSAVVAIGDYFAPTKDVGNALINTQFDNVTTAAATGILRAVESSLGVAVTTARVQVVSTMGSPGFGNT